MTPTPRLAALSRRRALAALAGLAALAAGARGARADPVRRIAPRDLYARIEAGDPPVILDVRTHEEYVAGHIPGAINISVHVLARRLGQIEHLRDREVVVHCEVNPRARYAQALLLRAGFTRLVDLDGHMRAWRAAGLPQAR